MNLTEVLLSQLAGGQRMMDGVIADVTAEQLAWMPNATTNSISATYAHAVGAEDRFIHALFQGKLTLWEADGWGAKLGMDTLPRQWDQLKAVQLPWPAFREYEKVVFADAKAYVGTLTAEELDRPVQFMGREMKLGQVLAIMISHTTGHAGEIAALKGVQGVKGLPY